MDEETTRWSLRHTGHHVICTEQVGPGGLEVRVRYNDLPIAIQRCHKAEDAARWAEEARFRWESLGQTSDGAARTEAVVSQVAGARQTVAEFGRPLDVE